MEDQGGNEVRAFGELLKKIRIEKANMGLRNFAELIEMQPSNLSNIEQGKIAPPADKQKIDLICKMLGLSESDPLRTELFDLAAAYSPNRIPADVVDMVKENPGIPVLIRTVDNMQLGEDRLRDLAEYIKDNC